MGEKKKSTPAQIVASIRYNQKSVTQFKLALNNESDKDIIEYLKTKENKQGYVKGLIRKDMNQ